MHARRWNAYDVLGQFEEIVGFYDQALAMTRRPIRIVPWSSYRCR